MPLFLPACLLSRDIGLLLPLHWDLHHHHPIALWIKIHILGISLKGPLLCPDLISSPSAPLSPTISEASRLVWNVLPIPHSLSRKLLSPLSLSSSTASTQLGKIPLSATYRHLCCYPCHTVSTFFTYWELFEAGDHILHFLSL